MKPSALDALEPEPVGPVEVIYKGLRIYAERKSCVREFIEDHDHILKMSIDFHPLVASLREEKRERQMESQGRVDSEKAHFNRLGDSIAEADQVSVESVKERASRQ